MSKRVNYILLIIIEVLIPPKAKLLV